MALVVAKRGIMAAGLMMAMAATAESLGTYYWDGYSDGDNHSAWQDTYQHWHFGSKTGPEATSIPSDEYDYVVGSGQVRPPQASATENTEVVLAGHSLTLNGGQLLIRNTGANQKITFNNGVTVANATIGSWNTNDAEIHGSITVPENGLCNLFESSASNRGFTFFDKFYGSGTIRLYTRLESGSQSGKNFIATFNEGTLSEFTGAINCFWRQSYYSGLENPDGVKMTMLMKGGSFPGSLTLNPDTILKLGGATTVGKLTLKDDTAIDFAKLETDGVTPTLEVTDELALSDGIKFTWSGADSESLTAILDGITAGDGSYTSSLFPAVALRVPAGMDADLSKLQLESGDPAVSGYQLAAEGRDYCLKPMFARYVKCVPSSSGDGGYSDNAFTSPDRWSDSQAPTDPTCGYILNACPTRTTVNNAATGFNEFKGGALISAGASRLIEQGAGLICNDLRIVSGTLNLKVMNGSAGSVAKFWEHDLIIRTSDGKTRPALTTAVSYAGRFGLASGATLSMSPYALRAAVDLQADLYGSGVVSFAGDAQSQNSDQYKYGSPVYRVSGDNSEFHGRFETTSALLGAPTDCAHLYFTSRAAFGGDRATALYNALQFNYNTVLHIPTTMCVDQSGLGVYLTGNASANSRGYIEFDVAEGAEFALKENLRLNNALWKTGAGTLALGGAKPVFGTSGVTTPTIGTNVLHIVEGGFKPVSAEAVNGLEVTFAEDTVLELEAVADISDGLGKYGMINTKWSTPFVLPEGGLVVKLVDPEGNLSKQGAGTHRIAIATVGLAAAGTLSDLALDISELPGYDRVELHEEFNEDDTVTYSAVLRRGCVIFVK